jgi:hypothetical protein
MSKHTLEQVLEALINKEEDRASDLLHQYFVNKGKSIYEELSQFDEAAEEELDESEDEEVEESFGGAADQDFEDEIITAEEDLEDESLFGEAEGEDAMSADEPDEDEAMADLAMGDEEMPAGDQAPEGDAAAQAGEKIDVATQALEDLKALFAELSGEAPASEEPMGDELPKEESFHAFGEATSLKAVPAAKMGDDGDKSAKSPVSGGPKVSGNGAKAVDFTGQADGKGGTQGGVLNPSAKTDDMGNVNKVGNAKAPAPKGVAVPKNSDSASNKHSPVVKS